MKKKATTKMSAVRRNGRDATGDTVANLTQVLSSLRPEERERVLTAFARGNGEGEQLLNEIVPRALRRRVFRTRPFKDEPYIPHDLWLAEAGRLDEERLRKKITRGGSDVAEVARAALTGIPYTDAQMRTHGLPFVVYLGGKEESLENPDPEVAAALKFLEVFGIACGLLGVSADAGGGHSLMAAGQEYHMRGINAQKQNYPGEALFPKSVVAGVTLAISQEAPNAHVSPKMQTIPAMNLSIRKARLFSLGFPLAAVFFKGGDATLDEWTFVKAQCKRNIITQIDTPFNVIQPVIIMVDSLNRLFWGKFLDVYEEIMLAPRMAAGGGQSKSTPRLRRKRDEMKRLREGLLVIDENDPESSIRAAQKALELMRPNCEKFYGRDFIETWEEQRERDFWDTVRSLRAKIYPN